MGCSQSSAEVPKQRAHQQEQEPLPQGNLLEYMLDIPLRFQWENAGGYCGETSIQTCSIYYGNYISQNQVRKVAGGQVLLGQNADKTVKELGYQFEEWDNSVSQPQYKSYLQWVKKNISQGYPVITVGYDPEGDKDEYDHIYMIVGVQSANIKSYNNHDVLIYMDLFDKEYLKTKFGKVYDTRNQSEGNLENLNFAIPKDMNYGIAIKGYKNLGNIFLPIRLLMQNSSEPNVSVGEDPIVFNYQVNVRDLEPGNEYALLRYDSYQDVPERKIVKKQAAEVHEFVAESQIYTHSGSVMSDKSVFYRCVLASKLQ